MASRRSTPRATLFDREVDEHDRILRHDAHQHQQADIDRHADWIVGDEQAQCDAAKRQRQRQENGDGLEHASEQQDKQAEYDQEASAHRADEAVRHFVLNFRVT